MQVGSRVGAIIGGDPEAKVVNFLGYGIYDGDHIPPKGVTFLGLDLFDLEHSNPKIILDSGEVVWGCQVWWGNEISVKKRIEQYEQAGYMVKQITMKEYLENMPRENNELKDS
jgi:hypothetical protein